MVYKRVVGVKATTKIGSTVITQGLLESKYYEVAYGFSISKQSSILANLEIIKRLFSVHCSVFNICHIRLEPVIKISDISSDNGIPLAQDIHVYRQIIVRLAVCQTTVGILTIQPPVPLSFPYPENHYRNSHLFHG